MRNLDRTNAATVADVVANLTKGAVAGRATAVSHTASDVDLRLVPASLLSDDGYLAALDCDVLLFCVDRPLPRWVMNAIAFGHLIPVVDGGIVARVTPAGTPLHVDWRIQAVGPGRPCLVSVGALRRSDVALDRDGKLDDPDYIAGLSEAERAMFFGQLVWYTIIKRSGRWASGRYQLDGKDIRSRTYFRLGSEPLSSKGEPGE